MSNQTNPVPVDWPCANPVCPPGKVCVEDEDFDDGYKCCQSRKKCFMKCKDPGTSPLSTRVPDIRDHKFKPDEVIMFRCLEGYRTTKSNGNSDALELKCLNEGNWSSEKPHCLKVDDPRLYNNQTTSVKTTTVPDVGSGNAGIIALSLLSCISLIAVFLFVYLYLKRRRNRSYCEVPVYCRKPSRQVELDYNHPTMPENLDEDAVTIEAFGNFVALRHNNGDAKFQAEFEDIQKQSNSGLSCEASLLAENQDKNRYTNISAYDHSRVRLQCGKSRRHHSGHSDYINANYVSSYEKAKAYIACQGPLPETFSDFWQMVWDNNVGVIVMITNLIEKGRRKCDQYWPQDGREQYKNFTVTLRDEDVYANYTVRTLQLRDQKQSKRRSNLNERRVIQFHYTQWPDHGTPEYILPLLTFIRRSTQPEAAHTSPIVVHCSAGVGRTGAYIMLDSMIRMARSTGKININKFLKFIRTQRNHLVQTVDQYTFLFDALLCHFICGNTECPGQRLKEYVDDLTKLPKIPENGAKTSDSSDKKMLEKGKIRSGMENQFLIVARQVVRNIDYDFAKRTVNENKNRSNGVLPVFRSRVPLNYRIGSEGSDYINASYLQGYRNGRAFIITQLPMLNTRKDFWSLVWDHNCYVIVTIRDKQWDEKDEYWPTDENQLSCPLFNVSLASRSEEVKKFGKFEVTCRGFVLEATKDDYVLTTTQLDINFWPTLEELDSDFTLLLNFLDRNLENKESSSVIVQDRFGSTAAAQLACSHSLHQQLANENAVDVFQNVRVAYQMRPSIFKSHKDLHFLYKTMLLETHPVPKTQQNGTNQNGTNQNGTGQNGTHQQATPKDLGNHPTSSDTVPLLAAVDMEPSKPEVTTENSSASDDVRLVDCDVTNVDNQIDDGGLRDDNSNSEKNSVATKESDVTITNEDELENPKVFEESVTSATGLLM